MLNHYLFPLFLKAVWAPQPYERVHQSRLCPKLRGHSGPWPRALHDRRYIASLRRDSPAAIDEEITGKWIGSKKGNMKPWFCPQIFYIYIYISIYLSISLSLIYNIYIYISHIYIYIYNMGLHFPRNQIWITLGSGSFGYGSILWTPPKENLMLSITSGPTSDQITILPTWMSGTGCSVLCRVSLRIIGI